MEGLPGTDELEIPVAYLSILDYIYDFFMYVITL